MKLPPCVVHSSDNVTTAMELHSSGGSSDSESEPLPEENPEPDGLPEDLPEIDEEGWESVG